MEEKKFFFFFECLKEANKMSKSFNLYYFIRYKKLFINSSCTKMFYEKTFKYRKYK